MLFFGGGEGGSGAFQARVVGGWSEPRSTTLGGKMIRVCAGGGEDGGLASSRPWREEALLKRGGRRGGGAGTAREREREEEKMPLSTMKRFTISPSLSVHTKLPEQAFGSVGRIGKLIRE